MKKLAALLALALAPAAPAVACDHAPVAFSAGYAVAAPQCVCPDPDAFAASSVQTYQAPAVTFAPVVQSYQSAVVSLPTVTHGYSAFSSRFNAYAAASSSHNAFSSSHNAFSSSHNGAFNRGFAAAHGHNGNAFAGRNRAFNRGFAAGRQAAPRPSRFGRPPLRREGIVTRALRAPGRILGGLFGR